jgi:GNAT superfamily N-acetyltransferase
MEIRSLRPDDRAGWDTLWAGYLHFYREQLPGEITDMTFARMSEGRDGCFALVAQTPDGTLAGLAHCVLHPTTWSRGGTCYLEDLFVGAGHRGCGAGQALIEAAGQRARAAGAETLYWHTQAFNAPARSLYDTVGHLTSQVHYERELG